MSKSSSTSNQRTKSQFISWFILSICLVITIIMLVWTVFSFENPLFTNLNKDDLLVKSPKLASTKNLSSEELLEQSILDSTNSFNSTLTNSSGNISLISQNTNTPLSLANNANTLIWFPEPNVIPTYTSVGTINEIRNEDVASGKRLKNFHAWGRITSYERLYNYGDTLSPNTGLSSIYIQIFFFEKSLGASSFYDWASDVSGVVFQNEIGDRSYTYYSLREYESTFSTLSYTFQQDNYVYRVLVLSEENTLTANEMVEIARPIAKWANGLILSQ